MAARRLSVCCAFGAALERLLRVRRGDAPLEPLALDAARGVVLADILLHGAAISFADVLRALGLAPR